MNVRKIKFQKNIFLIIILSFLLAIGFLILNPLSIIHSKLSIFNSFRNIVNPAINIKNSNKISCTRTTRLDNLPQYDRALSLIQQRIVVNLEQFKNNKSYIFTYFPPELVNCIKIIEEEPNQTDEFEGYFKFNGSDTKSDYFPIVVNSKYVRSDDMLIALLLSHELTHVQQYLDSVNNLKAFSCVDGEVDAFLASIRFYRNGFNNEEFRSIRIRIDEVLNRTNTERSIKYSNQFDDQLLMLDAIDNLYLSPDSKCKFDNIGSSESIYDIFKSHQDCVDAEAPILLKKMIEESDQYIKQCNL